MIRFSEAILLIIHRIAAVDTGNWQITEFQGYVIGQLMEMVEEFMWIREQWFLFKNGLKYVK